MWKEALETLNPQKKAPKKGRNRFNRGPPVLPDEGQDRFCWVLEMSFSPCLEGGFRV